MSQISNRWIAIGALLGAIGVALGAFGAHVLPQFLADQGYAGQDLTRRMEIFDTAIQYQTLHALALVFTGLALDRKDSAWWRIAAWLFLLGVIVFSGLLKVLTLAPPSLNWLGAIVPIGGVSMILGWTALAIGAFTKR